MTLGAQSAHTPHRSNGQPALSAEKYKAAGTAALSCKLLAVSGCSSHWKQRLHAMHHFRIHPNRDPILSRLLGTSLDRKRGRGVDKLGK